MFATTSLPASITILTSLIEPRATACSLRHRRGVRQSRRLHLCAAIAFACFIVCAAAPSALAQRQADATESRSRSVPDASPSDATPQSANLLASNAAASANVAGTVLDGSGDSVSGAEVSLIHQDGTESRSMITEANGEFSFAKILPGSYSVTVTAENFAPFASPEFVVTVGQAYEVPDVSLTVATKNTEVTVHPAEFIAAEQIRAAEKQRLLGVIPNFYTSYTFDAAPLTAKQKFLFAARGTFDPVAMIGVGFGAGIEQATNSFSGYGQGASGYAKRYAAKFADGRISDFLTHAAFPSLFHQDPRYFYLGPGSSFKTRLAHAVGSAFFTRSDSGLTRAT